MGFTEQLLHGETMDNVDADLLAALYNRSHPPFLNAYIRGKKHKDFRFFVRTRVGALPQFDSPEEVALISYDPEGMDDGVWYLAHLKSEYLNHTTSSHAEPEIAVARVYGREGVVAALANDDSDFKAETWDSDEPGSLEMTTVVVNFGL